MAWTKLGSTSVSGAAANTSWKEVGRTTLDSISQNITCEFTPKDNMMFLYSRTDSTNATSNGLFRLGYDSVDSGSNYSDRKSAYGNTDSTSTSASAMSEWDTGGIGRFDVINMVNIANQEKILSGHNIILSATGSGTAPYRVEWVGKWANTSNQANRIYWENSYTGGSDGLAVGTEIVALGYDNDEADAGSNFWQELATIDVATAGDNFTTGTFTAKKYLMVETNVITSGGAVSQRMTFNDDTGSNYAQRKSFDGASDTTSTNSVNIDGINDDLVTNSIGKSRMYIMNIANKEKLGIAHSNSGEASGAGNAPTRDEEVFKWNNTSAQITKIDFDNNKAGNWAVGSFVKVYGAD